MMQRQAQGTAVDHASAIRRHYMAPERLVELDRQDVQQTAARVMMATTVLAALGGWGYVQSSASPDPTVTALCVIVAFVGLTVGCLLPAVSRAARFGLLGLWLVPLVILLFFTPFPWVEFLLLFPVLAAAVLIQPWAGLLVAVALAGLCLLARGNSAAVAALAIILASLWQWAVLRPLYSLLERYSQRSLEASLLTEELRDERGKLNRTIKDLDASYQLLRQMNTDLILARKEADSLRDLRHRFATNLSHELRTPLNIVLGFSRLIYRKPQLYGYNTWSEALRRDLAEIQRNASHLSQLVDDVIDLARVDALAMPVRREYTDLHRLVEETLAMVRSLAEEKGLALQAECSPHLPMVPVDPVRIRQVLYNLLTNAIRYTDAGSVQVQARLVEAEVVLSVVDTGRGIPADELSTIFNEFYQVGRPKTDVDSGKGLGLAIAKRFVQLHGGRIWAESEPGHGSSFSFSLPLAAKTTVRVGQTTPLPLAVRPGKPKVLVIDESEAGAGGAEAVCHYLSRRLENYEFVAVPKEDVLEAALAAERPLAVIGRLQPGLNNEADVASAAGDDVPSRLPAGVPFVRCTLPGSDWLVRGSSFAAVLTKPVESDTLLETISRVGVRPKERRSAGLAPAQGEQGAATDVGGQERPLTILIADDDRGFVQLLMRTIESACDEGSDEYLSAPDVGHRAGGRELPEPWRKRPKPRLLYAYNGRDALATMRRAHPDVVLLDLLMSDMSGFDVVAQARLEPDLRETPIIAVTAATPGEDEVTAKGAAVSLSANGGFRPGALLQVLGALLGALAAGVEPAQQPPAQASAVSFAP